MIEKKSELVNRVIFTILMILIYRFGTFIPVPGINSDVVKKMFLNINEIIPIFINCCIAITIILN